ncbi:MAG TPA: FtsX-like permease family protein, partial [Cytophagaceae bacterium]
TKVPDNIASAKLQQVLIEKFPNVTIIDLRQVLLLVGDIVNKISNVISFMAFFSIVTGIIVLIGAVATSKYQRIKEAVLLRTLGAGRKQLITITALEYLFLGGLASLSGILLAFIASTLLAVFTFNTVFTPPLLPALIIFTGISILTLLVGLFNSRSVISSPPLEVLRKEV